METIDTTEMTDEQLEQELAKRKEKKRKKLEKNRKNYEQRRESRINEGMTIAKMVQSQLIEMKRFCHTMMDEAQAELSEYGAIRSNSKGGFSMTNADGTLRIVRRRDTEPSWDERAIKAIELIGSFLDDTIKKKDKDLFEILIGFLEKNKAGELEYAKVFSLMKHRNKFNDERWQEGLRLLEESFNNHLKGYAYEFKTRETADGKWVNLQLNFSAVEVEEISTDG